jgi:threonine/homoserine/homoserine lactone efflux protein
MINFMDVPTFLKVVGIGFSIAAAVGPISLLCVQRTLQHGRGIGLASGFGIASADAFYGLIGGLGLTVITNFLVGLQFSLRLIGGVVLVFLGVKSFLVKGEIQAAEERPHGVANYFRAASSIFLLTLSNPMTIISFLAIYTGIGVLDLDHDWIDAVAFSLAIYIGSSLWWLVLVSGVSQLRNRFEVSTLLQLNRISGAVIVGFGMLILGQVLFG